MPRPGGMPGPGEGEAIGCLVFVFGLLTPRFVMLILWLFTDYLARAFGDWFWPTLGFFLLPTTTLTYAIAQNAFDGVKGWGLVILIIGIAVDFGLLGGGGRTAGRRRRAGY
ncbi:MAG TPA: hypothetical protein VGA93_06660 [Actinomycetota bacterium]